MLYEIRRTARCIGAAAVLSALALALTADPVRAQGGGTSDTWVPIGPPGADYIRALAIDPLNPTTIYVTATNLFTVFKSTDGGSSWTELTLTPLRPGQLTLLAIDPQTPTNLYAGWVNGFDGQVLRSTDGGASWTSTGGAWGGIGSANALVINPKIPSTVYFGQLAESAYSGGVFKTTDGGATWTAAKVGLPPSGVSSLAIDPQVPDTLYAGSSGAVYKTVDGGASWVVTGLRGYIDWVVIDPSTPATLYASVREGATSSMVYKSIDAGISWIPFQNGLPGHVAALVVDPHDSTGLYAATNSGVFRSSDGGTSWTPMNEGLTVFAAELAIDGLIPTTVYAGTFGSGLFAWRMTPRHTLSLQHLGDGVGLVTSSPAGISCGNDCTELFREGTVVSLSAVPGPGSRFTTWSGCDAVEEDGDCSVTMDGDRNVIATFDRQLVGLMVSTSGFRGGTVTSSPEGIDCGSDCSEWFAMGTVVTLTATPERGVVARWNGCDSDSGPGLTSTCTVTMTAGRSVTTAFRPKQKKSKHEPHGH